MPPLARFWSPQPLRPPRVPRLCFRTPVPLQAPPQPAMTVAAATAALAAGGSRASSKALAASQPQHSAAIFKHAWQVYHKLLEVDFLEHRCLYTALQELLLGQLADGRARSLLDLGCGDAMQVRLRRGRWGLGLLSAGEAPQSCCLHEIVAMLHTLWASNCALLTHMNTQRSRRRCP